jgi:hypothetical protein
MKMEAADIFDMLEHIYRPTQHHISYGSNLRNSFYVYVSLYDCTLRRYPKIRSQNFCSVILVILIIFWTVLLKEYMSVGRIEPLSYSNINNNNNNNNNNNSVQFNSCLFTCKFNSTEANYKVSTST